jgi:hypothetical protein
MLTARGSAGGAAAVHVCVHGCPKYLLATFCPLSPVHILSRRSSVLWAIGCASCPPT